MRKRKTGTILLSKLLIIGAWSALLGAQTPVVAPAGAQTRESLSPDFDSFEIVLSRNIFDPNRREGRDSEESRTYEEPVRYSEPITVSLLGTMLRGNEAIAFVSGSEVGSATEAGNGAVLAGHKITAIRADGISLEENGTKVDLPVGSSLAKDEDGVTITTGVSSPKAEESKSEDKYDSGSQSVPETGTEATDGGAESDAMKKMMERRRQELGE